MANSVIGYVGLGSNQADRLGSINRAIERLSRTEGIEVLAVSRVTESEALGPYPQPPYLNAVARIRTTLVPEDLLDRLMHIEAELGRVRTRRWGPRTIDLDLLLFGQEVIQSRRLWVPHPQMHMRTFVLKGLSELDPDLVHPALGQDVRTLAGRLNGRDYYVDPRAACLVCMAGPIGVGKTSWARALAERLQGQVLKEPYDSNPFLAKVYAGRRELALDCQLYFLVHRAGQLARERLGPGRPYVADYLFEQELIYAHRMLDPRQLSLYLQIHRAFSAVPARPLLVVYLQATPPTCLDRIRRRGRPYESGIGLDLLDGLDQAYRHLFDNWRMCPLIRWDAEQADVSSASDVEVLARQVEWYTMIPIRAKE